ncbi:MucR family transcriptional regulator [Methylobacterium oxalidis]|uniref:MucR family transcriptional regulator n=1 Tax=Methylobacterium oxalidis TaxID=944322 RepID=UPI00331497C3
MDENTATQDTNLIEKAAEIVSAYVSNNSVRTADLPELITSVHAALENLGKPAASAEPQVEKLTPAQIKKSVTPDAIISFIDGKPYKTLKRHLARHGLDPHTYRQRYGLPNDYPMVTASYSEQRSALAKNLGLGQQRRNGGQTAKAAPKASKGRRKEAATAE